MQPAPCSRWRRLVGSIVWVYCLISIWTAFITSNAVAWLSSVTPVQQVPSTVIGISGNAAFSSIALEMTQISVHKPHSSISSISSPKLLVYPSYWESLSRPEWKRKHRMDPTQSGLYRQIYDENRIRELTAACFQRFEKWQTAYWMYWCKMNTLLRTSSTKILFYNKTI